MNLPFDTILAIDFETAWSKKDYTLSKMTTEEYIRDERFKVFGACVHIYGSDEPTKWISGSDLPEYFSGIDWGRTAVLAHNAQFDVSILSWVYGAQPAFIFDTLSMARALRGVEAGNSLAQLARDFALPDKGRAVHSTDGVAELDANLESELADYCKHDVYLCERIFDRLRDGYPTKELKLIDLTLKMYTRPLLELDKDMLREAIEEERTTREQLLQRLGVVETSLASNDKFAALLEALGVSAPVKISKTTGKETLALAKNDALFQALCNHEREDIALLCEARLRVKSTIERTRAQRFLDIADRGRLPVPLSYFGAGTGRYTASKGSSINMQNLNRGSFLRKAIMAPQDHVLVVGDLSQIEPRVLGVLSDNTPLLDIFRSGGDVYATFGAQMFNIAGMSKESHPVERQSAKSALLGAGYQLGWSSFAAQLLTGFLGAKPMRYTKADAQKLGVTAAEAKRFIEWDENLKRMEKIPHTCTEIELALHCLAAKAIIDKFRAASESVVSFWDLCQDLVFYSLYRGKEHKHKCITFRKEEIRLPSGMAMRYPDLKPEQVEGRKVWTYADGNKRVSLYGGKITNNIVQGTARCVMTDGMLRVAKKYPLAGTVHDELIAVVPEDEAADAKTWVLAQMIAPVPYLPDIPLNADVGYHKRYGLAKG